MAPQVLPSPSQPLYQPLPAPDPVLPPPPSREREDIKQQRDNLRVIRGTMEAMMLVLAPRALLFVAMLGVLTLYAAALFLADWQHLLAAGVFGMIVFLPTAFLYWKG